MSCLVCDRPMRGSRERAADAPGKVHHNGRGLCAGCWYRAARDGELDQYPPLRASSAADFQEDVEFLHENGVVPEMWGERLGMSTSAVFGRLRRSGRPDLAAMAMQVDSRERRRPLQGVTS